MKDILIVEDGKQERERLERLFSGAGYSVTACESVGAAEDSLKHEEYRLAVLDIGLNDKSGSLLFNNLRRSGKVAYVIIFTGNPSVHLKQRFIQEGAVDYIVKASPQAQNEAFLSRVREVVGAPSLKSPDGLDLESFLSRYVLETSKQLFLDADNSLPECKNCRSRRYVVTFSHQAQLPPTVAGLVVCASCGKAMDPEVT
jgi:DNA-binding response OmpR family regulator